MYTIDKRNKERYELNLPLEFTSGLEESKHPASSPMTKNICAAGAFVETDARILPGSKVEMEIVLPLDKFKTLHVQRTLITVAGEVVRCDKNGMAFSFDEHYQYTAVS